MWDIYSIGDGEFLASVINAVAMLTGTGDFATLVRIGFGIGVLLITMQGALSGGRGVQWQEAFIGLVIYMIMFGPQVRVNVEDMYSGQVYPIDNVPLGVAATGSILSRAGYSITTLFETAFGTPSMTEQSYGMSLKRLQAAREAMLNRINTGEANSPVPGSDVEKSWSNYIQECTLTAVKLHDQDPTTGLSLDHVLNGELPEALHFADNDFYFTEIYTGGAPQTLSCDQAFLQLEQFTNAAFLPAAKQNIKAFMAPDSFLNTDQLLQNAMDGIEQYGINIDTYLKSVYLVPVYGDAVVQMHLGAKQNVMASIVNEAVQRRNAQWQAQKSVFETSVQPFITFMEALFYALTPIMGLVIGLGMMGMKMIGKYIVLALWIQMWMPVMAIVNHYIHAATAGKISAVMASVVAEPMSITGMAQWDGIIQNQLAVGGMLASSVPIIALFIVSGSYYALTNVAGQMTGQDHVDESKAAPSTPDPVKFGSMQTWDRERGQHGAEAQSAMTSFSWSAQDAEQTASTQQAMQSASSNFSSMLGQRVSAMSGTSEKGGESFSFGSGTRVGNSQSENMLKSQGQSLADRWSHSHDVTKAQLASFGASAATGKQSTPELSAAIKSQTTLSESESDQLANELQQTFKEDEGWNASYNQQVAKEFSQGSENIYTRGTGLSEDKQLQEAAQESYQATQSYNEAVTSGVTRGTRQDVDGVKAGKNLAANDSARGRLESAITSAGYDGAVQEWMASPSGQDTIRQMGGDEQAATSYAMLLTANGQNQYADNQQLSAPDRGRLEDTANSALAETFGQVGAPSFGDRASANESVAAGHTPQQGSVEGNVNNAVSGMRIPKAEQVRGNAGAGLADAQRSSRGPSNSAMRDDYSARTDHIRQDSQGAYEDFKAEDEKLTHGDIEDQNSRGSVADTQVQGPHALSEFGSNVGDIGSAAKQALTSDKGFYEIRDEQMAEKYQGHYDYASERGLTDEQATLYARTASLDGMEHRALDWVGNHISPKLAETVGWQRDYQEQTAALADKLDPEVSTSIQKAAYEGEGNNSGRLDRIASLNNPDKNFPERAEMSSSNTQGQSANSGIYTAAGDMAMFMPPEPAFTPPQVDSSPAESQPASRGGVSQPTGGATQDYGTGSASVSEHSAPAMAAPPANHSGSTGFVASSANSQPERTFASTSGNAAPVAAEQSNDSAAGLASSGNQGGGYASIPAPAMEAVSSGGGTDLVDSPASNPAPVVNESISGANSGFTESGTPGGMYASMSEPMGGASAGAGTGFSDSPTTSQAGSSAAPAGNPVPATSEQRSGGDIGLTESSNQGTGQDSMPAPALEAAPSAGDTGFTDSPTKNHTPAANQPSSSANPGFTDPSNQGGGYASIPEPDRSGFVADASGTSASAESSGPNETQTMSSTNGAVGVAMSRSGDQGASAVGDGAALNTAMGQNLESSPSANADASLQAMADSARGSDMQIGSAGTNADESPQSVELDPIVIHGDVAGASDNMALDSATPAPERVESVATASDQRIESEPASAGASGMSHSQTATPSVHDQGYSGLAARASESKTSAQLSGEKTPMAITENQGTASLAMNGNDHHDTAAQSGGDEMGYFDTSNQGGMHASMSEPTHAEPAGAGFSDSPVNGQPESAFASTVDNTTPAASEQSNGGGADFTDAGTPSSGYASMAAPALEAAPSDSGTRFVDWPISNSAPGVNEPSSGANSGLTDAGTPGGGYASMSEPTGAEPAGAGFSDSPVNGEPESVFASTVDNTTPAASEQSNGGGAGFTESGNEGAGLDSMPAPALEAATYAGGTGFADSQVNSQPGDSISLTSGASSEPNSGVSASLLDAPNVNGGYDSMPEPGQPRLTADASQSSPAHQPSDQNMASTTTGGYATDSSTIASSGIQDAPHFDGGAASNAYADQSLDSNPAVVADAAPQASQPSNGEPDRALASAGENAPMSSAGEAPAGGNWNDTQNTMTDGDSMLGLSDNTPASESLAQSDADSVPTQAPDNQPEGDISSQEGDWYTQAFASNQSSEGGQRENAAMAAQDEQLRSQLLEPKAGDGGDAGASSRQIGQDMGRT